MIMYNKSHMSPEYRGEGRWSERSHKEAAIQLLKDAGRYLPRAYLQSLVEHPGLTVGLSLMIAGVGLMVLGHERVGSLMVIAGGIVPILGLAANTIQYQFNLWNEYRLGSDPNESARDYVRRINRIRNFL